MPEKKVTNIAASVKEKLMNYSKSNSLLFNSVLLQFLQERLLHRISKSAYLNNFTLKGALLFLVHDISRLRPTQDIDLLGNSLPNEVDEITKIFSEISSINFNDGVTFDPNSVTSQRIIEQDKYSGVRVNLTAHLGTIRQQLQIDIGFGDVVYPKIVQMEYPVILDLEAPVLNVYSIESAVVEKFEAIVSIGLATSRMKDFYDIHFFASNKKFDLVLLHNAITETFKNRETSLEKRLSIYGGKFKTDRNLQMLWLAFLKKRNLTANTTLAEIITNIQLFIEPACVEVTETKSWNPKEWEWE
jgi:predicted nucleotidyltransferase component of viral defense system